MQQALDQSQSEEERVKKLEAMEVGLERGRLLLAEKHQHLTEAEQQLLELKEEEDWQRNYEPVALLYAEAYQFPLQQRSKVNQLVPQGGSQKSKVKSQKCYGMRFLGILNGCPIYAALY